MTIARLLLDGLGGAEEEQGNERELPQFMKDYAIMPVRCHGQIGINIRYILVHVC